MKELYGLDVHPDEFIPFTGGPQEAGSQGGRELQRSRPRHTSRTAPHRAQAPSQPTLKESSPLAPLPPAAGTGEANFLGGVARKYGAPFEVESCKAKFFEVYMGKYAVPGALCHGMTRRARCA